MMPELNGFQVCETIKKEKKLKDIPIILISALSDTKSVTHGFSLGAVDYITKPFQINEVLARVETQLNLQRYRRELEEKTAQLQRRNNELRELEQLRDNLVHMVVHDMKSPLGVINGYLKLVLRQWEDQIPEKAATYIKDSVSSTTSLLEMVNSLLDVSRMENSQITMNLKDRDLLTVAGTAVQQQEPIAHHKHVAIALEGDSFPVWCDGSLISRVITNLINNAIRFSPPDDSIRVLVTNTGKTARVEITDNGPGVDPRHHKLIFEKFGQVIARQEGQKYTTGLGLTFCRMAVEAHGGDIGIDSTLGKGSTFWFTLPLELKG